MLRRTFFKGLMGMPFGTSRGQGFNNPVAVNFAAGNVRINRNGMFIFSGTPATGNLIWSNASAAGTILGNAYLAGTTNYFSSGGNFTALNEFNATIQIYTATSAGGPYNFISPNGAALQYNVASGYWAISSGNSTLFVANGFVEFAGTDGFGWKLSESSGTAIISGIMAANHPGSSFPTVETWQSLSLTGTWTASGSGVNGFFYRLLPDNNVALAWDVNNNNANPGILGTLPTAYFPATTVRFASGWTGTGPVAYNDQFSPGIYIDTSGNVRGIGLFVATLTMFGTAIMPLGSL